MIFLLTTLLALAGESREVLDGDGRLVSKLVFDGDTLVEETTITYDDDGRITEKLVRKGEDRTVERWAYDKKGQVTLYTKSLNDAELTRTESTWDDGALVRERIVTPESTSDTTTVYDEHDRILERRTVDGEGAVQKLTTFTYDPRTGMLSEEKTVDGEGTVLDRKLWDRRKPVAPVSFEISGGFAYQTDVDLLSVSAGAAVSRKPPAEGLGRDPLEVRFAVRYDYGRSRGAVVNNQLNARFSLDLNLVAPRTTPFLFAEINRNPVFNQNIDVLAAPVGVKFDLVPRDLFKLDFSFAPVLNYRSILVPFADGATCNGAAITSDTNCDTFKVRGSFRLRLGYEGNGWGISDTIEYLPNLNPKEVSFVEGLSADSITRNTFGLHFDVTDWLSITEAFRFTRDPTLGAQADCSTGSSLLCDGMVLQNELGVTFTWQVRK